jgi:hypothetical protein
LSLRDVAKDLRGVFHLTPHLTSPRIEATLLRGENKETATVRDSMLIAQTTTMNDLMSAFW